jgi:hypothetical protein
MKKPRLWQALANLPVGSERFHQLPLYGPVGKQQWQGRMFVRPTLVDDKVCYRLIKGE